MPPSFMMMIGTIVIPNLVSCSQSSTFNIAFMDPYILTAVVRADEAIALLVVEELNES